MFFLQNLTFGDLPRSNVKKGEPTGFSFCQKIIVYTLPKPNQQKKTHRGYFCRVKWYVGTVCSTIVLCGRTSVYYHELLGCG